MNDTKRISFGYGRRGPRILKIEMPGGCVTIHRGLSAADTGAERIRVDIEADGERFSGEVPSWWIQGEAGRKGVCGWIEKGAARGAD
jgi:hypothetical protein